MKKTLAALFFLLVGCTQQASPLAGNSNDRSLSPSVYHNQIQDIKRKNDKFEISLNKIEKQCSELASSAQVQKNNTGMTVYTICKRDSTIKILNEYNMIDNIDLWDAYFSKQVDISTKFDKGTILPSDFEVAIKKQNADLSNNLEARKNQKIDSILSSLPIYQASSPYRNSNIWSDGRVNQCAGLAAMSGKNPGQAMMDCNVAIYNPGQYQQDQYRRQQIELQRQQLDVQNRQLQQMQSLQGQLFLMQNGY